MTDINMASEGGPGVADCLVSPCKRLKLGTSDIDDTNGAVFGASSVNVDTSVNERIIGATDKQLTNDCFTSEQMCNIDGEQTDMPTVCDNKNGNDSVGENIDNTNRSEEKSACVELFSSCEDHDSEKDEVSNKSSIKCDSNETATKDSDSHDVEVIPDSDKQFSCSQKPWVKMVIANLEARVNVKSEASISIDQENDNQDADNVNQIKEFTSEGIEADVNTQIESSQTNNEVLKNDEPQIPCTSSSDMLAVGVSDTDMFDVDEAIARAISDMIEYVESDAGESAAEQDENLDSIVTYIQEAETEFELRLSAAELEIESQEIHVDSFIEDEIDEKINRVNHSIEECGTCCLSNREAGDIVCREFTGEGQDDNVADSDTCKQDNNVTLKLESENAEETFADRTLNEEELSIGDVRHVSGLECACDDNGDELDVEEAVAADLDDTLQNEGVNIGRPEPEGFEDDTFAKLHAAVVNVVEDADVNKPNIFTGDSEEVEADRLDVSRTVVGMSESRLSPATIGERLDESRAVVGMSETVISPATNADTTCMTFINERNSVHPLLTSTPVSSVRNLVHYGQLEQMAEEIAETAAEEDTAVTDYTVPNVTMVTENNVVPLCTSTPMAKPQESGPTVRNMNVMKNLNENGGFDMKQSNSEMKKAGHRDSGSDNKGSDRGSKKSRDSKLRKENRESKREKRKMKGTRVERYKEYLGPGLTSSLNSDSEAALNASKKDFVRDTNIEKCTLTEYKGFGLTGPMPEHLAKSSTPLPSRGLSVRNPNIIHNDLATLNKKSHLSDNKFGVGAIPRWLSTISNVIRPAGTEGFLPETLTGNPASQHINAKPSTNKVVYNPMHGQKGTVLGTGPSHGQLSVDSGKMNTGTSQPLKPDDVYPASRGDKSESNSNRSDKSGEKFFDPKCLQSQGQLKLSAYMNFGLLTVHIVQGRQFSTKWKASCDSFVKLSLIPDDGKKPKCKTEVILDSNNPLYDEKFSLELNDEDHSKRLLVTVWHRDQNASVNEFLGCMSFGLRHLTNPKKEVSGWYYLLTEELGRKKHLQVSHKQKPHLKVRAHSNIPSVNKDVWGTESHQLTIQRGKHGFGFSVVEACPVRVGRVDGASPAEAAGVHPGDIIIRLNKQNVSRSTASSVAKLVKHSSNTLTMEVQRPRPVTFEQLEPEKDDAMDGLSEADHTMPQMFTLHDDEDKENEISVDNDTLYPINPSLASLATSTPLPLLARGHKTAQSTSETRKQEAIHRLLTLELDFIDVMHSGMQRYSRPLRHCILNHAQHTALFQNIEKLTTISEYHVKQMHDNAPSSFISEDTDTSCTSDNHNFIQSIGMIYQSKVHMLCQAYDLYARGISGANQALSDLRRSSDFMKFIREPLTGNQPSISTFIHRPVQHVRELYRVIQEIFLTTSQESPDFNSLKQVVEGLQECTTNLTNYSCDRVQSMSSIASRDSKTSFTCSMKSQSSTASSATSSSSKGQGHGSLQRSHTVDVDVMKIQDKLVFSSNVPVFQLCHDDRHLIFSGDMFRWEGHQWVKIHLFLFTDLLLQTVKEADGYLRVIHEPLLLRDVVGMDAQRQHGSEFVLYCSPRVLSSGHSSTKKLSLRAPSTEQKYAWKSLIEQRVFAIRGSLEYYSSTSDISSSSASAIII